jgi:hypothetical protein
MRTIAAMAVSRRISHRQAPLPPESYGRTGLRWKVDHINRRRQSGQQFPVEGEEVLSSDSVNRNLNIPIANVIPGGKTENIHPIDALFGRQFSYRLPVFHVHHAPIIRYVPIWQKHL